MNRNRQQSSHRTLHSRELPMPWSYKVDIWNLGLLSVWETSRASGKEGHAYFAAANPHQETTIVEIDGDTLCVLEEAKHH
ncbi:hypothetical protein E4U30_000451 [Claviceps sp. LM220 group G6]|nr:hypothetical protein E4U30_000451 [Claviceps sp. LM220 group G6]